MGLPLVYVNLVGGQDELVFDGESMVFDAAGELLYRAPQFEEDLFWLDVPLPEEARSDVDARVVSRGTLLDGDPEPHPESADRGEANARGEAPADRRARRARRTARVRQFPSR